MSDSWRHAGLTNDARPLACNPAFDARPAVATNSGQRLMARRWCGETITGVTAL